jgi:hypothetical protein
MKRLNKNFKIFNVEAILLIDGQCPYCHAKQSIAIDQDEDEGAFVEECEQCAIDFVVNLDTFDEEDRVTDEEE